MIVERLSLANFRGFEQIDLAFHPQLNVVAGINGVGKSAVIQAVAALLSRALPEFTPATNRPVPLSDDDVLYGKIVMAASLGFQVDNIPFDISLQREREDNLKRRRLIEQIAEARTAVAEETDAEAQRGRRRELRELQSQLNAPRERANLLLRAVPATSTKAGDLDAPGRVQREMLAELSAKPNHPLALYYSTRRLSPEQPRVLPPLLPYSPRNAYEGNVLSADREVELRDFLHWFRVAERGTGAQAEHRASALAAVRAVVSGLIPEFRDLRVEEEPVLRFVVQKNDAPLSIQQLSDGERGLLAVVIDLARRLTIANPHAEEPVREGKAVVLIDEIELHLHPSWQRSVLTQLRSTFQSCQFIVTTHSPQVIGEVHHSSIRFLLHDDGKIVSWTPPRSLGLDSSRVLEELMDVRSRNNGVDEELHRLALLIDEERFAAARELIGELEETLGESDPDLTRARTLMAFVEGRE